MFCVVKLILLLVTVCAAKELSDEELHRVPKLYHLDDYDRCLSQTDGVYCLGTFELAPTSQDNAVYDIITERLKRQFSFDRRLLHRGYCLNKRCPSEEKNITLRFEQCADKAIRKEGLTARLKELAYCTTHAERKAKLSKSPDLPQRLFLYVVYLILFLNALGTVYDVCSGDKKNKYLVSWSVPANWRSLTTVDDEPSLFAPIQSCKIILHCIIIYTHANLVQIMGYLNNPEDLEKDHDGFVNVLIRNGTSLVQVFILISSFFVGYNVLQTARRSTISTGVTIKWILKRIFRLAPVYLLLIAYSATWWPRYGDGPLWSLVEAESQICRDKFWTHVLFINNVVQPSQLCMVQSWAIAADVQLYLVSLLLTLLLARLKVRAVPVLGAMFVTSCLLNVTLAYVAGLVPMVKIIVPETLRTQFRGSRSFFHLHTSPWSNLPACFLGLLMAHIYFEQKNKTKAKVEDDKAKSNETILNGLEKEGALVNGNGALVNGNGVIVNENGAISNGNCALVNRNGALVNGNGALVNGNGPIVNGNGAHTNRNGAIFNGNCALVNGNGTTEKGNGALLNGNGAIVNGNYALLKENGAIVNGNGPQVNGNGAIVNGNGALFNENGVLVNRNAAIVNRNCARVNGNGALVNGNGAIVNGNSALINGNSALVNKNGTIVKRNGALVNGNGTTDNGNGALVKENEPLVNGNGTLVIGNGVLVNGSSALANGSAAVVNGNVSNDDWALPNGNTLSTKLRALANSNGSITNGMYNKKNGVAKENDVDVKCINENGLGINGIALNTENGLRNRMRVSDDIKNSYTKNPDYICEKKSNGIINGVNNQNGHSNCNGYGKQNAFLEDKNKKKNAPFFLRYAHLFTLPVLIVWIVVGSRVEGTEAPAVIALYVGLERLIFSLTFAMQLLQVITVKGPWARAFSWRGWTVPARLVMCVAMVHWCVNMTINGGRLHPAQYSRLYVSIDWLATVFYSYVIAIPLCILVELPMKKAIDALVS